MFRIGIKSIRVIRPRILNQFRVPNRKSFFTSSTQTLYEFTSQSIPASIDSNFLPFLLATLLIASDEENDEDEAGNPNKLPWTVKDFKDRGLGVVSSRSLERGELLIAERPICLWPQGLTKESAQTLFDQMSSKSQNSYMSLAKNDIPNLDDIRAIRATNGFAVQFPSINEEEAGGSKVIAMVFPKISRINHSCLPNASQAMNFKTLRMEVYSITPIPSNSEINIEYLPTLITQTQSERQQSIKEAFGFSVCLCSLCTGPKEEIKQSDKRRKEIKSIGDSLRSGSGDRSDTLNKMGRIRVLLREEGYNGLPEFDDPSISNAYAVYITLQARSEAAGK